MYHLVLHPRQLVVLVRIVELADLLTNSVSLIISMYEEEDDNENNISAILINNEEEEDDNDDDKLPSLRSCLISI